MEVRHVSETVQDVVAPAKCVDGPGYYVVLHKAVVTRDKVFLGDESVVTKVGVGNLVKVLEVEYYEEEARLRARIEQPAGWMSLLNTQTGRRWAQRAALCPRNHTLRRHVSACDARCGACGEEFRQGTVLLRCRQCEHRLCPRCVAAESREKVWTFRASASLDEEALGFNYEMLEPFRVMVRGVEEGSWAQSKGVKVGDELVAANGVRLDNDKMKVEELDGLFRSIRPLELTFLWDAQEAAAAQDVLTPKAGTWPPVASGASILSTASQGPILRKLQDLDGRPMEPHLWGVSRAQCRDLLRNIRRDPDWKSSGTVEQLAAQYIAPATKGTGLGYALWTNRSSPKEVNVVVTHSRHQNAEEFLETVLRSTYAGDVLFISALALYQAQDSAGPSIKDQLGDGVLEGPWHQVLQHIASRGASSGKCWRRQGLLRALPPVLLGAVAALFWAPMAFWGCVPTHDFAHCAARTHPDGGWSQRVEWTWQTEYTRIGADSVAMFLYIAAAGLALVAAILWLTIRFRRPYNGRLIAVPCQEDPLRGRLLCSYLVLAAKKLKVPTCLANTLAAAGSCRASEARCHEVCDEAQLRRLIEESADGSSGYEAIDAAMRSVLRGRRWAVGLAALYGASLFALLRSADLRLVANEPWRWDATAAPAFCVLGAAVAALLCTGAAWWLLWRPGAVLRRWALCAAPLLPLACGSGILLALALSGRLRAFSSTEWSTFVDFLSDEGYRHSACTSVSCHRAVAFSASLAQTLIVGGINLTVFIAGAICCPQFLKRRQCIVALTVAILLIGVAAAIFVVRSLHSASDLPEPELWHAVFVFYATQILARCAVPLGALCGFAACWGLPPRKRLLKQPGGQAMEKSAEPLADGKEAISSQSIDLQMLPTTVEEEKRRMEI